MTDPTRIAKALTPAHISPDDPRVLQAIKGLSSGKASGGRYNHNLTDEQILRFACRGGFSVSRQYRQDRLRNKALKLKKRGLLEGGRGKRYGDGHLFTATQLGKAALHALEQRGRSVAAELE